MFEGSNIYRRAAAATLGDTTFLGGGDYIENSPILP